MSKEEEGEKGKNKCILCLACSLAEWCAHTRSRKTEKNLIKIFAP